MLNLFSNVMHLMINFRHPFSSPAEKLDNPQEKTRNKLLDTINKKNPAEIGEALKDYEKLLKTPEERENEKGVIALAEAQKELLERREGIAENLRVNENSINLHPVTGSR